MQVTVVNRLLRQLFHSYGNECSIVMGRSSQKLWNDRPNCDPCGLTCSITVYADYLSSYLCRRLTSQFIIYDTRWLYLSLFTLKVDYHTFPCKYPAKNSGNGRKRAEKSLSSSSKSPMTMRSKPLFQSLCHHDGKSTHCNIIRWMENNGIFYTLYLQMNVKERKFFLEMFGAYWKSPYLCTRFWEQRFSWATRKRVLWKIYITEK